MKAAHTDPFVLNTKRQACQEETVKQKNVSCFVNETPPYTQTYGRRYRGLLIVLSDPQTSSIVHNGRLGGLGRNWQDLISDMEKLGERVEPPWAANCKQRSPFQDIHTVVPGNPTLP